MLVYAGGSSIVSGSAGSWALLGPASSCCMMLTALSCLDMPDLRELPKAVVGGDKALASSSGVAERGSENDVTPDCRQAELGESDSNAEFRTWSVRAEVDDIVGAVTR